MDYVHNYWKSVLCGILFAAVVSVNGRPSESQIDNAESDKSNGLQILEFNPLDAADVENESLNKNKIVSTFKKFSYNVSYGGLNIPVQVIYDVPDHYIKDLLRKSSIQNPSKMPSSPQQMQTSSAWSDIDNENALHTTTRRERNSKHRNFTNVNEDADTNENLIHYSISNEDDFITEPVSIDLKSFNRTNIKNPMAVILTTPDYFHRVNNTKKKVPVILQLFSPTKNEYNDTIIERIDHKYLVPILEKLKQIANRHQQAASAVSQNVDPLKGQPAPVAPHKPLHGNLLPFKKKVVPHHHYYPNIAPYPFDTNLYMPVPTYPPPQYYPYDYFRRWPSPYASYLPFLPRDPLHEQMNYYPNTIDYEPQVDPCHQRKLRFPDSRTARNAKENKEEDEEGEGKIETEKQVDVNFEDGKRRYDDNASIEYIDHIVRPKRSINQKKDYSRTGTTEQRARPSFFGIKKEEKPTENKDRATDVGPQISKLIVRRGGVAIAGAGGIATAGSGGTAIVGPGGTALTTPASSGGVAMVGPGGKVINVPDIANVLYGRTASVTATGAGHATFTNRHGEVFTTSDNTGGVALINPNGNVLGVSDNENIENENGIATADAKEVQLPAGARLLTTGPIIYYNPVYPTNHLR